MGNEGKDTYEFYLTDVDFGDGFFKLTGGSKIKFEANPDAPKDIEGSYTLTVNGRTTTLSDGKDTVSVTCHVDDNFDIGEGVRQCFEKLKEEREKKIRVGDKVEVINSGHSLSQYVRYFNNEELTEYAPYFRYGVVPMKGMKGQALYIDGGGRVLIKVEDDTKYGDTRYGGECYGGVYIIGLDGLRKVVD